MFEGGGGGGLRIRAWGVGLLLLWMDSAAASVYAGV